MAHLRTGALRPRPAPEARVIPAVAVKAEPVIKRGDPVVIEAGSDGFSITREGVAMADAAPGGHFPVRIDPPASRSRRWRWPAVAPPCPAGPNEGRGRGGKRGKSVNSR
ncbi:hypothetical protein GCM10020258_21940 [Sphingomonas yabuuchiae]